MLDFQYWHCPNCHGNFDPDEKCDCEIPNSLGESEWQLRNKAVLRFSEQIEQNIIDLEKRRTEPT